MSIAMEPVSRARPRSPSSRRRRLFSAWVVASLVWLAIVGTFLAGQIDDQLTASRAVAADIAHLNCAAPPCTDAESSYRETWLDVADLFWTFGGTRLLAFALGPPFALLLLGVVALHLGARRPR